MQLDLFVHARDVMLRNDVLAALRARDANAGSKALAALRAEYPSDTLIAPLIVLLETRVPVQSFQDHKAAARMVESMHEEIVPAARCVFDAACAHEWLAVVWRSLASAAMGLSYKRDCGQTHAAFLLLQAGDWSDAAAQVATIPSWRRVPEPLAWMAEARHGEHGLGFAWCFLAELAWIDPSHFRALARRLDTPALQKLLQQFENAFDWEDESDFAWFPAWALIAQPALAAVLRETQRCNGHPPEQAARVVMELLSLERQGRHADIIQQRKRLRDLHPALFSRYMSTR